MSQPLPPDNHPLRPSPDGYSDPAQLLEPVGNALGRVAQPFHRHLDVPGGHVVTEWTALKTTGISEGNSRLRKGG